MIIRKIIPADIESIVNFNDYLEMLNICAHTTFYDKYKDGYYGKGTCTN